MLAVLIGGSALSLPDRSDCITAANAVCPDLHDGKDACKACIKAHNKVLKAAQCWEGHGENEFIQSYCYGKAPPPSPSPSPLPPSPSPPTTFSEVACNATLSLSRWTYNNHSFALTQRGQCLSFGAPAREGFNIKLSPCATSTDASQRWVVNASSEQLTSISANGTRYCLDSGKKSVLTAWPCQDGEASTGWANEHFALVSVNDESDGDDDNLFLRNIESGLCVDSGTVDPPPARFISPCGDPKFANARFCDASLEIDERVADYMSRITLEDKIGQLTNNAHEMNSVNVPRYQWWSEALHGVAVPCHSFGNGDSSGTCPTSFPQPITTAQSLNRTLWHLIGNAVGTEARAFHNLGAEARGSDTLGLTFWTPNINIFRDPRWGRGHETPGEDPTINADYAEDFVGGFQARNATTTMMRGSACCKHFALYSLEGNVDKKTGQVTPPWGPDGTVTRHNFNAVAQQRDLVETYFPAFISCANRGNASGVMCSYNAVNGIPSCANKELLTTNLRESWGFDGYVTGDCGAVNNVKRQHGYTKTDDATVLAVLRAGTDNDCGGTLSVGLLRAAMQRGTVKESDFEATLKHLFRVQFRLGLFDRSDVGAQIKWSGLGVADIDTPQHRELALEAALQGLVLLKNDNGTLPLRVSGKNAHNATLAVVGPNANATTTLQVWITRFCLVKFFDLWLI